MCRGTSRHVHFFVFVFVTTPVKMRHINSHPIFLSQGLLKHAKSNVGRTPLEIAELLMRVNVYEGIPHEKVKTMKQKTLVRNGRASFATVLCFAHVFDDAERRKILVAGLSGFLHTNKPNFEDLLVGAGFEGFLSFCKVFCQI